MPKTGLAPPTPILALTLALAGKRRIAPNPHATIDPLAGLVSGLETVFLAMGEGLGDLRASDSEPARLARSRFDTESAARLTLVTGLADGADQIASEIFLSEAMARPHVDRVLGAVLPCDRQRFEALSPVTDTDRFSGLAERCEFIIELDGDMPAAPGPAPAPDMAPEPEETKLRRLARARAFTAQSELLLRQCDILIAVDDPRDEGRAGGTRQTMRIALELGLPVVLLRLGEAGITVLKARADLDEPGPEPEASPMEALRTLAHRRLGLHAEGREPGADGDPEAGESRYADDLLQEFHGEALPRREWLGAAWDAFQKRFEPRGRNPASGRPAAAYAAYRARASALGAHYASRYRGAFLAGYALAVVAVALAVISLLIIVLAGEQAESPGNGAWWALLALGALKLATLFVIIALAGDANSRRLALKAADYRYLAERLRALIFLPAAGVLRAPNGWSQPYTSRVTAQGAMDRLLSAIERQARPLEVIGGERTGALVRPDAQAALDGIRQRWIESQRVYHERSAETQEGLARFLEQLSRRLNQAVILIVVLDLVVTVVDGLGIVPEAGRRAFHRGLAPLMIAAAAILPAAVASLNGVRFQSECARLADRSRHIARRLGTAGIGPGFAGADRPRILDALRLGEDMARLANDEVAEWSAIYGKEFVEM
jgi:hypothetical protein